MTSTDHAGLLRDFTNPPAEYAPAPLWWWTGVLDRERLEWQMDQLEPKGVLNPCVVYVPLRNNNTVEPDVRSDAWWDFFIWATRECRRRGMSLFWSDYHIDDGLNNDLIRDNLQIRSSRVSCESRRVTGPAAVEIVFEGDLLSATAYRLENGDAVASSAVSLLDQVENQKLTWRAEEGKWLITVAYVDYRWPWYVDAMRSDTAKVFIDENYRVFEDRMPELLGDGMGGIMQDELNIWKFPPWSSVYAEEFERRKGYDIRPLLPALWHDIGPITPKVRIDYYDVLVQLVEENYFKPIYEFNEQHGLIHSHDNWGRRNMMGQTTGYGDYFRTMRWYAAPGYDSPIGGARFFDAKLASSIAHLYDRPRVWCEAFHSCGWDVSPGEMLPWINELFAYGMTVWDAHQLYYETMGGWFEWAPPSAHFRQPYWRHYGSFAKYVTRLSWLLSQGEHVCDVAVLYPVTALQAEMGAQHKAGEAPWVQAAGYGSIWTLAEANMDTDYMDFDSLARAQIAERELRVAGERYKVMLLPGITAVRYATMEKLAEFHRNGGIVVAYGRLPAASERQGYNDPELDALVSEVFGLTAAEAGGAKAISVQESAAGGQGVFIPDDGMIDAFLKKYPRPKWRYQLAKAPRVAQAVSDRIVNDFQPDGEAYRHLHRRVGDLDIYFVASLADEPRTLNAFFRTSGLPETWDPWSGEVKPVHTFSMEGEGVRLRLDFEPEEAKVIVFRPDADRPVLAECSLDEIETVTVTDDRMSVTGWSRNGGEQSATVSLGANTSVLEGEAATPPDPIIIEGDWEFELVPTRDNRWGDYRRPPSDRMIGAEARLLRYAQGTPPYGWQQPGFDDDAWEEVAWTFGPEFMWLGPVAPVADTDPLEAQLAQLTAVEGGQDVSVGGVPLHWQPYAFSRRWGVYRDEDLMRRTRHGNKGYVPDEYIDLGEHPVGSKHYLWTAVRSPHAMQAELALCPVVPAAVWLNGERVALNAEDPRATVPLREGVNHLLVRLTQIEESKITYSPGGEDRETPRLRSYVSLRPVEAPPLPERVDMAFKRLGLRWFLGDYPFAYDIYPERAGIEGCYRFETPPGARVINFRIHGEIRQAWIAGEAVEAARVGTGDAGAAQYRITLPEAQPTASIGAVRIVHEPGRYGGAALAEPVAFECGVGQAPLKEWRELGLKTYSGTAWYRKSVNIPPEYAGKRIILDLGVVAATCEVHINGRRIGEKVQAPWRFDITDAVKPGGNRIEVLVANTLGDHYTVDIPSRYAPAGGCLSGLIGPVLIEPFVKVEMSAGLR